VILNIQTSEQLLIVIFIFVSVVQIKLVERGLLSGLETGPLLGYPLTDTILTIHSIQVHGWELSVPGIRCLFDPWIRDPGWVESQHPDPGSGMNNPDHIF
jgi:hypothetical protein